MSRSFTRLIDYKLRSGNDTKDTVIVDAYGDVTTVDSRLVVTGEVDFYGGVEMQGPITDDDDLFLDFDNNNTSITDRLAITHDGGLEELVSIRESGHVGIGITEPGEILVLNDSSKGTGIQFGLETNNVKVISWSQSNSSWSDLDIRAGSGNQLYLHTNGNIGIGTTAPTGRFDVVKTAADCETGIYSCSTTDSHKPQLMFYKSGSAILGTKAVTVDGERLGLIGANGVDTSFDWDLAAYIYFNQDGNATATRVPGRIEFHTNSGTARVERMRITSDGKVGIGTTNPRELLEIKAATPVLRISDSKALSSPAWDGTTLSDIDFYTSDTSGGGAGVISRIRAVGNVDSHTAPEIDLAFWTGNTYGPTEKMRIGYNGHVGIGTISNNNHFVGIRQLTVDTGGIYYGINNYHIKTAGASDASDIMAGMSNIFKMNQNGGTIGTLIGLDNRAVLTNGTATGVTGIYNQVDIDGGASNGGVVGVLNKITHDGGVTVTGNMFGSYIGIDQASGTTVTGQTGGQYIKLDMDGTTTGRVSALEMELLSGVDYAIYQTGVSPSYFAGNIGIGTTTPGAHLEISQYGTPGGTLRLSSRDTTVGIGEIVGKIEFWNKDASSGPGVQSSIQSRAVNAGEAYALDLSTGTVALQKKITISPDGYIGIGTTAPTQGVTAYGAAQTSYLRSTNGVSWNEVRNNDFVHDGGDMYITNVHATGSMVLRTNSNAKMLINSAGIVGFNTTNLETWNSSYRALEFPFTNIMYGTSLAAMFLNDNVYYDGAWKAKSTGLSSLAKIAGGEFQIRVSNGSNTIDTAVSWIEAFTVTNTGKVGIGITNTAYPFDVQAGTENFVANFESTDDLATIKLSDDTTDSYFHSKDGVLQISHQPAYATWLPNVININGNAGVGIGYTNPQDALCVNGNVGIGTINPAQKLDVVGQIRCTDDFYLRDGSMTGDVLIRMYDSGDEGIIATYKNTVVKNLLRAAGNSYFNGGNIGIGTTSPSKKLHIYDSSVGGTYENNADIVIEKNGSSFLQFKNGDTGFSGIIMGDNAAFKAGALYYSHSDNYMRFDTLATERMKINSIGTVGIGTTNPSGSNQLHVVSNGKARAIYGSAGAIDTGDYIGVYGTATSGSGSAIGVYGYVNFGIQGAGVSGRGDSGSTGVNARTDTGYGLWASATAGGRAIYAVGSGSGNYAIYAIGEKSYFNHNVGIGYTNPAEQLCVNGNVGIGTTNAFTPFPNYGGELTVRSNSTSVSSSITLWQTSGTAVRANVPRMTFIHSSGAYFHLISEIAGGSNYFRLVQGGGTDTDLFTVDSGGRLILDRYSILATGTGTSLVIDASNKVFKQTSTLKAKHDIVNLEFVTDSIYDLRPVSFTWNEQKIRDFGLIAEEVDEIIPELVQKNNDGEPEAVKYSQLSVLLLSELKKLKEENEKLNERVIALENK